ncbi:hypothetical protein NEAUS06_1356 [Nematocida ausubeli]|nr:hypothetical protein NEAUS06_1356 [Nematocida ausubeli]
MFFMNILRTIKSIGSGLIFTTETELLSTEVYTSYLGYYKSKPCTVFKYKNGYAKKVEEAYPLLKYVQDVLHIMPEVIAYQKHGSYFYIITARILPLASQEEISTKKHQYELFNQFISTNISIINDSLIKKNSIILESVTNMGRSQSAPSDSALLEGIDYADIYYDADCSTKAMVFPAFRDKNTVKNTPNVINALHALLGKETYADIYNMLASHAEELPDYYIQYIMTVFLAHFQEKDYKIKDVDAVLTQLFKDQSKKREDTATSSLYYIVSSIFLFSATSMHKNIEKQNNTSLLYVQVIFFSKNLYDLSMADINDLFLFLNKNMARFKKMRMQIIEMLFDALPVLSSNNKMLFIQLLMKEVPASDISVHIKRHMKTLIEIDNVFNLLILLLNIQCTINYKLGLHLLTTNISRIEIEGIQEIIPILSRRCTEEETIRETISTLRFIVEYMESNINEIKNGKWKLLKSKKIKNQKQMKSAEREAEWKRKNKEHINEKKEALAQIRKEVKKGPNSSNRTWENDDW